MLRTRGPYLLLAISIFVATVVIRRGYDALIGPVVGVLVGSVLAIVLDERSVKTVRDPIDWRKTTAVASLYVVAMIAIYRNGMYTRPLVHYPLLASVVAFLAYQIWVGQPRHHVIPQLLVVAFFTYWSTQFVYPAGVITPDTGFVGISARIAATGTVPSGATYRSTPAHMIYVGIGTLFTDLSARITYQTLSVLYLLTAIGVVGFLDKAIPGINKRIALYSALAYAFMSFTFRRGMYPFKTNFFRPFLLVFVFVSFTILFHTEGERRYSVVALVCVPPLLFGHMYSTGAALILLSAIWGFHRITTLAGDLDYQMAVTRRTITGFFSIVLIGLIGYSLVGGPNFIGRLAGVVASLATLFEPSTATGGTTGGRYSELPLASLLFATTAQAIFFALGVAGTAVAIRRRDWSVDVIAAWIAMGMGLLAFSVFANAVDIPPPRIYALLGTFGLNIMVAIALFSIANRFPGRARRVVVVSVTFLFVVFSLASPVGSVALSPVSQDVPDKWRYYTAGSLQEEAWADEHAPDTLLETRSSETDLPLRRTSSLTATTLLGNLSRGTVYEYGSRARLRGVKTGGDSSRLGGNLFLFYYLPDSIGRENKLYANGQRTVYMHHNATNG